MANEKEAMTALLRGKVLRRKTTQRDQGWCYEKSEALFLYSDGTFRYQETISSTAFSGGLSLPSEKTGSLEGSWEIDTSSNLSHLVLTSDGLIVANMSTSVGPRIDGTEHHYLDGQTWTRYSINS